MTEAILITKTGSQIWKDINFSDLINMKLGELYTTRIGVGFSVDRNFKKVSDYAFVEVD
jgi:hypothetical protein